MKTPGTSTSRALHAQRTLGGLVVLLALLHHTEARAQDPALVLVAVDGRPGKLEEQLQAELRAADLTPQPVAWSDVSVRPDGLLLFPKAPHAAALLHLSRSPLAVDVWLADRNAGGLTRRESLPRASDDADARLVAVRASELVRAALLPLREAQAYGEPQAATGSAETIAAPAPSAATPETSATGPDHADESVAPTALRTPRPSTNLPHVPKFGVALGTTLSWDPDGFGRGVRVNLDACWRMADRWTLASAAVLPTVAQVARETNGKVALRAGLLDLELRRELAAPSARLRPRIGLGAGLAWAHLRKRTYSPAAVHRSMQYQACLLALVGGSLRVWSRLSLALDLRAGAALPRAVAHIDGPKVGSAGIPVFIGSLSLELPFG